MEKEVRSLRARKGHSVYGKKIGKTRKHSARFIGHKLQLRALDFTLCPGSGGKPASTAQMDAYRGAASGNGGPLQYLQPASHASLPPVLVTLWESDLGSHATKDIRIPSGGF